MTGLRLGDVSDALADDTPRGQRWREIERLLTVTPTTTLEGLSAQAELVAAYFPPDPDDFPNGPLLTNGGVRNLSEAVRRLAGQS